MEEHWAQEVELCRREQELAECEIAVMEQELSLLMLQLGQEKPGSRARRGTSSAPTSGCEMQTISASLQVKLCHQSLHPGWEIGRKHQAAAAESLLSRLV